MKDKILIILGLLIAIAIVIIIALVPNKESEKLQNTQELDLNSNSLSNTTIDNGLLLENSKVECGEKICIINMIAKNNTDNSIDMTNYRISFLDSNGEEIYWYSGSSIGNVIANSETQFSLEIPKDLKTIKEIVYIKNL